MLEVVLESGLGDAKTSVTNDDVKHLLHLSVGGRTADAEDLGDGFGVEKRAHRRLEIAKPAVSAARRRETTAY